MIPYEHFEPRPLTLYKRATMPNLRRLLCTELLGKSPVDFSARQQPTDLQHSSPDQEAPDVEPTDTSGDEEIDIPSVLEVEEEDE